MRSTARGFIRIAATAVLLHGASLCGQETAAERHALAKSHLERTELAKKKTGVFTGAYAINPVNEEKIPIWIADYVLVQYGTGAIMAVPGHDERDYEFARKFGLPIVEVVSSETVSLTTFSWAVTAMPKMMNTTCPLVTLMTTRPPQACQRASRSVPMAFSSGGSLDISATRMMTT